MNCEKCNDTGIVPGAVMIDSRHAAAYGQVPCAECPPQLIIDLMQTATGMLYITGATLRTPHYESVNEAIVALRRARAVLAHVAEERDENEGVFKAWRKRAQEAEEEAERLRIDNERLRRALVLSSASFCDKPLKGDVSDG